MMATAATEAAGRIQLLVLVMLHQATRIYRKGKIIKFPVILSKNLQIL